MTDEKFEQAAHSYSNMIYRVACHALSRPADAEDVTQTVLLRLYQSSKEFQNEEHLRSWLLRVTVNESRKLLRTFWHKNVVELDEEWDAPAPESDFEDQNEVLQAVMSLDPKYRLSIYLYYYEECSVKEIAELLKSKPSTVQTWLQRAREKLRVILSDPSKEGGNQYV